MRIPVIIISGFLGSGKTTLLLSLLKESAKRGLTPGVVMNELGQRDVDGYIVQEHTGTAVQKLLDGCICCSRKEELEQALVVLVRRRPDVIYIELTGVADPAEITGTLLQPSLRDWMAHRATVTVVDAYHALEYNSRLSADKQLVRTLRSQLATGDVIIVNKSDLVEQEVLWGIEKMIRKYNPRSDIVFTHYSTINLAPLLTGIIPKARVGSPVQRAPQTFTSAVPAPVATARAATAVSPSEERHDPSFSQVAAVTLTFPAGDAQLDSHRLEAFFDQCGSSLLRAKGHVRIEGREAVQLVQYAGERTHWEDSSYPGAPYVVCIGMNLNEAQLDVRWKALFG
ncbi:CobW family GTP-binding protein [Paenibacillus donghaensis]|uniref:CobW C-terminal domain-containing protein n=1 Tax=Paenibacillus donghaensis TaxID=414771 RepID=A0A2Z2KEW3_9BACL|nr:CobW family GTP-binding protein [Paenibacillus donghaensis]ASA20609.1 hypothetical protein B9T62_07250 [Paenibacillus donghaensis]